jgi:hypothetical protein
MPDQPYHLPQAPEGVQRLILRLLLGSEQERLWPLEVVVHRVGDPITALDALVALSDAGLVHPLGTLRHPHTGGHALLLAVRITKRLTAGARVAGSTA